LRLSYSFEERSCMIVRFFKMGLLPLTAIVPVFDQGIWSCRMSSVSFGRRRSRASSKGRKAPILLSNVRGPQPSRVILAMLRVGLQRTLPPLTRGKRVRERSATSPRNSALQCILIVAVQVYQTRTHQTPATPQYTFGNFWCWSSLRHDHMKIRP